MTEQCPGGCGQTVDRCICKKMEEAKNKLKFKPLPETPDLTVGEVKSSKLNKEQ